jgi:hypothetical protein
LEKAVWMASAVAAGLGGTLGGLGGRIAGMFLGG